MTNTIQTSMVFCQLHEATVAKLLEMKNAPEETINEVILRILEQNSEKTTPTIQVPTNKIPLKTKYTCQVLGEFVGANTLYKLFGAVIDEISECFPEALDNLAKIHRSNKRRYIAPERNGIHIAGPSLGTIQTKSGWFIDTNVSRDQTLAALKALCQAANLEFGKDICFPVSA